MKFGDTQASVLLDLVRGLAALLVVGEHWRNIFFVDYGQLPSHKLLWIPPYLLTAAGHQAVVIFFVLSGYLISGSIFRAMEQGRWSWLSYATHRLVRLWVVVVPGLLVCAACDTLGLHLHRAPGLYSGLGINHITPDVRALRTMPIFLGNLFFVQGIRVPMFGSDGALWSLANEFWYYVLFPLGLFAALRGSWARRLICAGLFAAVWWFLNIPVLIAFPIWLLGVALFWMKPPSLRGSAARWAAGGCYGLLLLFLARFRGLQGIASDAVLGLLTVPFLWILLSARDRASPEAAGVRWSRLLARGSFTLYVVHTPILVLLASLLVGDGRWTPTLPRVGVALLVLAATLLLSYGLAAVTEFRTDAVRGWVERELGLHRR